MSSVEKTVIIIFLIVVGFFESWTILHHDYKCKELEAKVTLKQPVELSHYDKYGR